MDRTALVVGVVGPYITSGLVAYAGSRTPISSRKPEHHSDTGKIPQRLDHREPTMRAGRSARIGLSRYSLALLPGTLTSWGTVGG